MNSKELRNQIRAIINEFDNCSNRFDEIILKLHDAIELEMKTRHIERIMKSAESSGIEVSLKSTGLKKCNCKELIDKFYTNN